ncbi:hypothetical protein KUF57_21240 [Mycolicibacterium sp. PAM1]|uniref:Uncharacterized protein n=2 Tax=Mycolicibacterium gilvum TaxID=1804 RepID=A0A378SIZ0_9MYCO|nr:hypothetical protein [Mycolicibacterium gilvum]ABP47654.1 conserved hypothetical protein [Mycolicibacterium gilvum PYR-GCK]MBV5246070.1 hypothetical protein [Mycolicibacterium sp. PAM1]MCV7056507.1 hypothetical protein [Mycolicibacterium gilvum]STZ41814.1 Uncharacterised protein [Mycolicibacterium gilvum]
MSEQPITELSVHIPCGGLRGPVQLRGRRYAPGEVRWQSCSDEVRPVRWADSDVSRECDLCVICLRATAGGRSRWSWLACENCRAVNSAVETGWGIRPFALGRHSVMNGITVRCGAPRHIRQQQIERVAWFADGFGRLREWRNDEFARLARRFDPEADVPLRLWQQEWPPGPRASRDAFARVIGPEFVPPPL